MLCVFYHNKKKKKRVHLTVAIKEKEIKLPPVKLVKI